MRLARLQANGGGEVAAIEADGSVLFEGLRRGSYEVLVGCAQHVSEPTYAALEVGDSDIEDLVWTVRAGLTIRGRVVDSDKNPVRAAVRAYAPAMMGSRGAPGALASTEADGSFAQAGLPPGDYRVSVSEGPPVPRPLDAEPPGVRARVEAGKSASCSSACRRIR
ncbi:carboxypeptidase-like regulatory domain-containing protein [Sorangium cellulosum]|uniref:Carboxypeptidase regulatory-like domain-containing protein n=1 Tax=Sorangium cellulosum TaxID=56 RepID=A0A150QBQ8_SORCE|nr:carboxypeptidase-like regulatory domain-containing protein [Sorangium cellulosum]KYF65038.1 hypothetical protein BE15_28885 [Sorangium cellulosum]